MKKDSDAKKALLQVVDNQIRANNPPETKQTLQRLVREGYTSGEAKELIASLLVTRIHASLQEKKPFDDNLYVRQLKDLPAVPWGNES